MKGEKRFAWNMASVKEDDMNERLEHIKQEDCEWGAPEDVCVKLEECEGRISCFKEKETKGETAEVKVEGSEHLSVSLALQNLESWNNFKQDVFEDAHFSLQPSVTNTGQLATRQSSVELKSELLEFDEKINERNKRGEEEEVQQSSRREGIIFQETDSFLSPSFTETSLQLRLQHKQDKKKMEKSTEESENLTPAFLQCSSNPAARQGMIEAIITDQHKVHNTDQGAQYVYRECRKMSKNIPDCTDRKLIHVRQKPYACSECGKMFSRSQNLHIHKIIHTGEKPHCCSECGKRFSQIGGLQRHTRIHTGEKPYCCSECGKRFSDSSALQKHTRIHTGEKPYCCGKCGKKFTHSSSFHIHKQIHSVEKPYCCSECGKRFLQIFKVHRHMRIHIKKKSLS
ncbi:zinc finger protein 235-like [Polypterus senegalus]|uniref:zinc finger protein 235-like n=1 Tax=Polypterus senegalus TaxID=55291 RepID=UPI00196544B0|nr:zinc finger protein 235-like [Polypterus senegalus]